MIKEIKVEKGYFINFIERAISCGMNIVYIFDNNLLGGTYIDGIRLYEGYKIEFEFKEDTPSEVLEKEYICYDLSFPDMIEENGKKSPQVLVLKIKENNKKETSMEKKDVLLEIQRIENRALQRGIEEDRVINYGNLLVYIDDKTPFFNIAANVSAGGLDYKSGVAHFAEHILSANPSEVDIFTKNNIFNNASTSILDTRYYLDESGALLTNLPKYDDKTDETYKELAEVINSYIDEFFYWWKLVKKYYLKTISDEELEILTKEFDRHKSVIREEINMQNKKLEKDLANQIKYYSNVEIPVWYKGILGSMEDLEAITLEDVAEFYKKYYKVNSVAIAFNIPKAIVVEHEDFYKKFIEPKIKSIKEEILVDKRMFITPRDGVYHLNYKEEYDNALDTLEINYAEHSKVNFALLLPNAKEFSNKHNIHERQINELAITLENAIYDQLTSRLRKEGLVYGISFMKHRSIGMNEGLGRLLLFCFTNNHDEVIKETMDVLRNLELSLDNVITDERMVLKDKIENNLNRSYKEFLDYYDLREFRRFYKGKNYPDYFYETFYILNDAVNGKYDTTRYEEIIKAYLEEFKNNLEKVHILKCIPKNEE